MRNTPNVKAERYRVRHGSRGSDSSYGNNGAFRVPVERTVLLGVIVSDGGGWDHISVSLPDRCPTWAEMCLVKELFFRDDEWAMQLHPPRSENISHHDYCLHLWRPQTDAERAAVQDDAPEFPTPGPIPLPPSIMVGPRSAPLKRDAQ